MTHDTSSNEVFAMTPLGRHYPGNVRGMSPTDRTVVAALTRKKTNQFSVVTALNVRPVLL